MRNSGVLLVTCAKLVPGGRVLNHCITRADNYARPIGRFIDRSVFPDGELTGSGGSSPPCRTSSWRCGRGEPPRALALHPQGWCRPADDHWDACVDEVGIGTAEVLHLPCLRWPSSAKRSSCTRCSGVQARSPRRRALPLHPTCPTIQRALQCPGDTIAGCLTRLLRSAAASRGSRPAQHSAFDADQPLVGTKVVITSSRPQTTRTVVSGSYRPDAQLILVDTPGLHRPRRCSARAQRPGHHHRGARSTSPAELPGQREDRPRRRFFVHDSHKVRRTTELGDRRKADLATRAARGAPPRDPGARRGDRHRWAEIVPVSAKRATRSTCSRTCWCAAARGAAALPHGDG